MTLNIEPHIVSRLLKDRYNKPENKDAPNIQEVFQHGDGYMLAVKPGFGSSEEFRNTSPHYIDTKDLVEETRNNKRVIILSGKDFKSSFLEDAYFAAHLEEINKAGIATNNLDRLSLSLHRLTKDGLGVKRFRRSSAINPESNICHVEAIAENLSNLKRQVSDNNYYHQTLRKAGFIPGDRLFGAPQEMENYGRLEILFRVFDQDIKAYDETALAHDGYASKIMAQALIGVSVENHAYPESASERNARFLHQVQQSVDSQEKFEAVITVIDADRDHYGNTPMLTTLPKDYEELQQLFYRYHAEITDYKQKKANADFKDSTGLTDKATGNSAQNGTAFRI